jgi:hypothetical protein
VTIARRTIALLLLLHAALSAGRAQTLRGRLVSADSSRPVAGAIVVLRDTSGADVARVLSNADGSFLIRLPAPGLYRVRALRIGFRPGEFGPYRLGTVEDLQLLLPLLDTPIALSAIRVAGQSACRAREKGGDATLAVWEEARKAGGDCAYEGHVGPDARWEWRDSTRCGMRGRNAGCGKERCGLRILQLKN